MTISRVVVIALVSGALSASACSGCRKKDAAASASAQASLSASAPAPFLTIAVPPVRPFPASSQSADAPPGPKPPSDPTFADITNAVEPAPGVDKAVAYPELAVHWSVPGSWVTENFVPAPGKPHEQRRTSRSPDGNAFFDVLGADVETHTASMWKGQPFPQVGLKPDGGVEGRDWTPFASVSLGKVPSIGSHYTDGRFTYAWIFFKHPKSARVLQVILTWPSGDEHTRKVLASIAGSLAAE